MHNITLSIRTIHKVLKKNKVSYLQKKRYYRKVVRRYNCNIPGERVQMDVCKIANKLYQFTAIDDCTRYKVIALYPNRSADNTLDFLDKVIKEMPFAIY